MDCHKYWICVGGRTYPATCPGGLVYNYKIFQCDDRSTIPMVLEEWYWATCNTNKKGNIYRYVNKKSISKKGSIYRYRNKIDTKNQWLFKRVIGWVLCLRIKCLIQDVTFATVELLLQQYNIRLTKYAKTLQLLNLAKTLHWITPPMLFKLCWNCFRAT